MFVRTISNRISMRYIPRNMSRRSFMQSCSSASNTPDFEGTSKRSNLLNDHLSTTISSGNDKIVEMPQVRSEKDLSLLENEIKRVNHLSVKFTDHNSKMTELPPNFGLNQSIAIEKDLERELNAIVNSFNASIEVAIGYGSGVFEQAGYTNDHTQEKPQIDMIFGVTDPLKFHTINLIQNPHHYSSMKYLGSSKISSFQELGAGIYFNPFTEIMGHQVKYGVVSMERLLRDLSQWDTFYLAGRLQKPVKFIKDNMSIKYWNQINLRNAATLAKHLTLKKRKQNSNKSTIDEFQFYKEIAGLSYLGDIRYTLGGENPNKITNIVTKNFDKFKYYYGPIWNEVVINGHHSLPQGFTYDNSIHQLRNRIAEYSILQTAKGVFTAGVTKSIKYAWNKKMKAWKQN
ncbi:similar to Saccharomyces cerevisiae YGR046W TAM41 Mitochondrial protein involved in protein import into the mitochondrial matrix [Maudiozyma saulgeensis]|uniref:Phosphatidate cytidylyltransferase, mitochondrial n=1 Tax=Maudiozyma saulgeensis TaxID=1789683 RepID=A0A1X7R9T5_9SACH|nr:similar to Saccharomyces cerevisiae YGR046W TAM41 Mitochondrial protein involved in protein import into the mitochondrial matrix [Kazachstania saulgeensis]